MVTDDESEPPFCCTDTGSEDAFCGGWESAHQARYTGGKCPVHAVKVRTLRLEDVAGLRDSFQSFL